MAGVTRHGRDDPAASALDDRSSRDGRPSPDALLKEAEQAGRGRLKIFLGAAPGVGKTYRDAGAGRAAPQAGRRGCRDRRGRDPWPGRNRALLTKGLETIPQARDADYKGRVLAEMDLDAILQRRPQLVLVDELAHDNAPGSRHPKRYMDVEELLAAGIDVYTTLNVQHVESLNDVVASITRVRVRETVPDSILDRADEIELVDLTPEDLIQRLKDGKVYLPDQAERAPQNYFSPGNLTALRELALRRTAQRVDAQMVRLHARPRHPGPWAAGERVLVCVGERRRRAGVVRYARRLADRLQRALDRDPCRDRAQPAASAKPSATASPRPCAWPSAWAAEAVTVPGARTRGRHRRIRARQQCHPYRHRAAAALALARAVPGPLAQELIRRAGDISVHVVGRSRRERSSARSANACAKRRSARRRTAGLCSAACLCRGVARRRSAAAPDPGGYQCRAGVPDGGAGQRGGLRPVAVAVRLLAQRAGLQFLLPAAALHLHHRRPRERRRAVLLRS